MMTRLYRLPRVAVLIALERIASAEKLEQRLLPGSWRTAESTFGYPDEAQ